VLVSGWENRHRGYDVGATRLGRAFVGRWRVPLGQQLGVLVVDSSLYTPRLMPRRFCPANVQTTRGPTHCLILEARASVIRNTPYQSTSPCVSSPRLANGRAWYCTCHPSPTCILGEEKYSTACCICILWIRIRAAFSCRMAWKITCGTDAAVHCLHGQTHE
jgi:hypothetical protein